MRPGRTMSPMWESWQRQRFGHAGTRFVFPLTAVTPPSDPEHALRAPNPRRPLVALLIMLSIAAAPARAQEPRIDDVEESLVHDASYKVRVEAALILGKLRQQRSVPALVAGLKDGHP